MDIPDLASHSARPVVKRMYGRRRELAPDASVADSTAPIGASPRASSSDLPSLDSKCEYPPTSDGLDASASSSASLGGDASSEDNDDGDARSSHFEFGWKKKLRAMNEDDELVQKVKDASAQRASDIEAAASPQPPLPIGGLLGVQSEEALEIQDSSNVDGARTSLRDDSPVASHSPSPAIQRHQGRRKPLVPTAGSDSESSNALDRSPLRAVFSDLPSPAPSPTFPSAKAKGKQKITAVEASDDEQPDSRDDGARTSKRRRSAAKSKQKRVKPPTKKEWEETQKTTARIMAEREATLPKEQSDKKYDLSHLLGKLKGSSSEKDIAQVEVLDTDPIQPFSSSPSWHVLEERPPIPSSRARSASLKPFARTPSPALATSFQPTGLLGFASNPVGGDSSEDEEMPDIGSLIHEEAKKREEQERLQRLAEAKRRALEQQQNRRPTRDEDDSDLEVVHEDMHAVAREEAQARRADTAHGVKRSVGRNVQLALAGVPRRKSVAADFLSLSAAAAPAFLPKKTNDGVDGQLKPDQLSLMMLRKAKEQAAAHVRQKEVRWKKAGGKVKARAADVAPGLNEAMAQYAQKLSERQVTVEAEEDKDKEDEDDPDYQPVDEDRGAENGNEVEDDAEIQHLVPSQVEAAHESEDDEENMSPVLRGRQGRPRRPLVAIHSDDEEERQRGPLGRVLVADSSFAFPEPRRLSQGALHRRASTSSLEGRKEDGTDKENDASLMYDRGDDKENTVVASQPSAFSRAGSFFSQSQGRPLSLDDGLPMESTPQDGRRAPFQELPIGEDDENPFSFSSNLRDPARRLTFSPGPPLPSLQSDENVPMQSNPMSPPSARPVVMKGGLADLFETQASNAAPSSLVVPKVVQDSGLSEFFSQQSILDGPAQIEGAKDSQDLALTEDVALQPALDLSQTLRRKADDIFEKEQQIVAEGVARETSPEKKRLYVNEHGFLTQTRPMRTPARSQLFSPTQTANVSQMSIQDVFSPRPATRQPLATIDAVMVSNDDDDDLDAQPRMRLKRRKISPEKSLPSASRAGSLSPSPRQSRNVFDIMKQASLHPHKLPSLLEKKAKRSEFIEGEAEESDDDMMMGFGTSKRNDDEEEDDETQDQALPELVDDQEMDEDTLAEGAVMEKHREHIEQDDQENERLHQNAIQGKLRMARRNRGVGFEDDDSDEDDDDAARARRRMQRHKRKIDGDSLDDLARNPDTVPFAQAYQDGIADEDDFAYMEQNEDTLVDVEGMDVDKVDGEEEEQEQEVVPAAQIREELRAAAREDKPVESIDPRDVSWVDDGEYEEEVTLPVKEFLGTSKKVTFRKDADWDPSTQPKQDVETEHDRVRMQKWAKGESRVFGTGRASSSVSVTGGGKKKAGTAPRGAGRTTAHGPKQNNKVIKTASVLSTVATSRRGKFQG
ncbi:hypothetical protein DAEQUDRAFT_114019 [Daedalea quercina L-15889]|uniref:DNA replication checkpoint mediator MRC1 domain-containing protein n=1 Tax=Daedalea quercina L-15889 TaxID=1314783 RepID=A0A165S6P4_9APHY|nr:hypothetical protein DAEQUDRAFT_114019 [Daedalea quercina L-15889]